ncbi:MAG TPA: DUF6448 family protein [Bacteroidota bacterium]|nr:DUF6448 family protein [Bacteroidota bacterium]
MKQHLTVTAFLLLMLVPNNMMFGHCDTMNGPVVTAARKALEKGDVNLVLIWVQKADESEIKEAFQKALAVRKLGGEAKALADKYFFETVVRVHRAGEGVGFMGLKADDTEVHPGIEAADQALEKGSVEELVHHATSAVEQGIHRQFVHALEMKKAMNGDVEAGREFVKAYVRFIHYAERVFESAKLLGEHGGGEHIH